eukprot:SAG31_NODE_1293_length_8955_cov_100.938911_9_plen_78_part_00
MIYMIYMIYSDPNRCAAVVAAACGRGSTEGLLANFGFMSCCLSLNHGELRLLLSLVFLCAITIRETRDFNCSREMRH